MKVKVIQRIPDKVTHEKHECIKHDIELVEIYKDGLGEMCVCLKPKNSHYRTFSLNFFDFEIVEG